MFASSFLRFTKELVTSPPLWAAPCKMQMKFLLQHCQSISWEVSYLSFHKIVSAVQGIFLPIRVLKCLCSFQLYFCFSQAQCSIFQDSLSAKFSSSPQSTTCPRSIFPKAFVFGALINLLHDSWLWYTSLNWSFLEICPLSNIGCQRSLNY